MSMKQIKLLSYVVLLIIISLHSRHRPHEPHVDAFVEQALIKIITKEGSQRVRISQNLNLLVVSSLL